MKQAFAFLTVFGRGEAPSARALPWFPVVGVVVGLLVGLAWWASAQWFPLPVAGAIAVIVDLALTGMLHVDGLADSSDGLLPPLTRERRLEVMRDPRIGAFGVVGVVATLLLRAAVLGSISPGPARAALVIGAIWCTSRAAMAIVVTTMPYARPGGLATAFAGGSAAVTLAVAVPLAVVLAWFGSDPGGRGLLAIAACGVGAAAVATFARSRLDGFTGDVLGAAGVVGETLGLLILAAHA